jgi:hypothetical protein
MYYVCMYARFRKNSIYVCVYIYIYIYIYILYIEILLNLTNIIRHIKSYVAIKIYIFFLIFPFRGFLIFCLLANVKSVTQFLKPYCNSSASS